MTTRALEDDACKTCRFFRASDNVVEIGWCKKKPPVSLPDIEFGSFPYVDENEWCGEHERKFERSESP